MPRSAVRSRRRTRRRPRGIRQPIQIYPLFENALRAKAGRSVADHQAHLGAFYSGFSEIAIDNPYAWDRRGYSPDEIAVPAPKNRMVGFPYTKLMCSNEQVDESAAMILCSVERARVLGIAEDRWVFPFGIAEAAAPLVSERYDLSGSTMADASSRALWELTGLGPDEIAHVDLYSCFPSAVQVQAGALGFGLDRPLTVTGGMRFSGGPWNNYAMHGLATMVGVLRGGPWRARSLQRATVGTSASCRSASIRRRLPKNRSKWCRPRPRSTPARTARSTTRPTAGGRSRATRSCTTVPATPPRGSSRASCPTAGVRGGSWPTMPTCCAR